MGGMFAGALEVMAEQCTGRGVRGVVAAAAPLAAALGAQVLREGGNAFDAVVTAGLAESVLLPPKCGLAGDLVSLRLTADQDAPVALVAIGGAPAGLADALGGDGLPLTGPLSVGVPGAPAGWAALAAMGTAPLAELAAPAARLAREGVVWAPICATLAEESWQLVARWNPGGTRYFPAGRALAPGEVVRLPGLGDVLDELGRRGADLFSGPLGDAILDAVRGRGGILTADDLARYGDAQQGPAAEAGVGGRRVWATPAPTHGAALLDALSDAAPGDRADAVLRQVLAAITRRRASLGDRGDARGGTSMVSAADADGNAVVVVHSNSFPRFGSGIVVEGLDLILANRAGRGFTDEPGHPNFPAPGKRPATTLHAWCWGDQDGRGELLGGTPGGANQMPWNRQLLQQVLDGEQRPGVLVAAPRWEWLPAGPGEDGVGAGEGVRVEEGLDPEEVERLRATADHLATIGRWGLRSAQQVVVRPTPGRAVVAAVDPRTGGAVVPA